VAEPFTLNLGFAGEWAQRHGRQVVDASARIARDAIVDAMEQASPRSGRTYLKPGTRTPYVASAPGEPPAIREGVYANSYGVTPAVVHEDSVVAFVTNPIMAGRVPLGLVLEEGHAVPVGSLAPGGSGTTGYILPRPHIRPGLEKAREIIQLMIARLN